MYKCKFYRDKLKIQRLHKYYYFNMQTSKIFDNNKKVISYLTSYPYTKIYKYCAKYIKKKK